MNFVKIVSSRTKFTEDQQTEIKGRPAKHVRTGEDYISKFLRLLTAWREETLFFSSTTEILNSKYFNEIVAMGDIVVPLIIAEIRRSPDFIVYAIPKIIDEDLYTHQNQGDLVATCAAWLEWYSRKRK